LQLPSSNINELQFDEKAGRGIELKSKTAPWRIVSMIDAIRSAFMPFAVIPSVILVPSDKNKKNHGCP
jgi:hypothetical protein